MPLLLGSMLATGGVIAYIYKKNELLYHCERSLLEAQKILLQAEGQILRLNPQIETKVIEKRILKKALTMSPTPADKILILAQLARIEITLSSFKMRQRLLKSSGEGQAQQEVLAVKREQLRTLHEFARLWRASLVANVSLTLPTIKMVATPIDPSATIYKVPPQMSVLQTLTLHWSLRSTSLFPRWMFFFRGQTFYWQDSCSTFPQSKELSQWHAEIGPAISL